MTRSALEWILIFEFHANPKRARGIGVELNHSPILAEIEARETAAATAADAPASAA